jgi:tetratricopeptide (TPR) repeat protein
MDNNGQLTFSDDPLLRESATLYQFISEGTFNDAVKMADQLMNINPDYPGLIEAYRPAKFWSNRENEIKKLGDGKKAADFLMKEWKVFEDYASLKEMKSSSAYKSAMKYIFFKASEQYKLAFKFNEETDNSFDLLINLGECFLRLKEYKYAIETLEYAMSSYKSDAKLLYTLGESYYHVDDIPKCLLYMREAFLVDPSQIDLTLIEAKPVLEVIEAVKSSGRNIKDIREWIPVFGYLTDVFYVRRNLNKHQLESLKREVFNLEKSLSGLSPDDIDASNIIPRLLNKYLWLFDYYRQQNVNTENSDEIKSRLLSLDKELFEEFFKKTFLRKRN